MSRVGGAVFCKGHGTSPEPRAHTIPPLQSFTFALLLKLHTGVPTLWHRALPIQIWVSLPTLIRSAHNLFEVLYLLTSLYYFPLSLCEINLFYMVFEGGLLYGLCL